MGLFNFSKTIGIDPGSYYLRLVCEGEIIFNEPSVVSVVPESGEVSGHGFNALENTRHETIWPVNRVIGDFHAFENLLRHGVNKGLNETSWLTPAHSMYFSIPVNVTEVEKRAYRDSGLHAGAREVYMTWQPVSAAIGLGVLQRKKDFVIVDISASKTEVTVFSNSWLVCEGGIPFGTCKLWRMLRNFIFRNFGLRASDKELDEIIASLGQPVSSPGFYVQKSVIKQEQLSPVWDIFYKVVEDKVLEIIEQATDCCDMDKVAANGMYFTGGGALVSGLCKQLALSVDMDYAISNEPLNDNIKGIGEIMKNFEQYKKYLFT
ncbi:rod shape-determining protein [Cytophagaceae bacterium ABcell3]|nr:rod shape-determining protein [Cytophagaceae bacterium ABcell3]